MSDGAHLFPAERALQAPSDSGFDPGIGHGDGHAGRLRECAAARWVDESGAVAAAGCAPVDLGFAQGKSQQAQSAMASRKYDVAGQLADEARADAELARAKARL